VSEGEEEMDRLNRRQLLDFR